MDWAEELKMSIRKTARKGRRSKSRDVKDTGNDNAAPISSGTATSASVKSPNIQNKEISIDITLDMQQTSTSAGNSDVPTSVDTSIDSELRRPPLRRISGGWADTSGFKSSKSKKGSFDDDRFQFSPPKSASTTTPPKDEIPIIPDLDDIKDELLLNEIAEPPSVSINRAFTLKELNSDLLSQKAFSAIEDVDLSILTRCLQPQENLDEPDEVWEWDKLFTDVVAEINSDKQKAPANAAGGGSGIEGQKRELGPDELPPTMHV